MKKIILLFIIIFAVSNIFAQKDSTKSEKIKKGFSFGPLPVVAYNSDEGFKYGALLNIFHYGDGSNYPNYNHKLYLEWSRTTNGGGINQLIYDTKTLIPKTRMTIEAGYFSELALDFYGFNGYQSNFNSQYSQNGTDQYISRVYYRHARNSIRFKADFQGIIKENKSKHSKLNWLAGFAYYGVKINTSDIALMNKKQKDATLLLPDTATLYDKYVEWGVIKNAQKNGGNVSVFKAGLVFDSRDNEANPNKGIWSEALVLTAPGFIGNEFAFTKIMLTHRQYFTIFKDRLTFAYRVSYQSKIAGEMPFYMMPLVFDSKRTRDGLGGAKNIRGILRNRVVGDGFAFSNMEFRWKFLRTVVLNQNLYLALNPFVDAGMVTNPYKFSTEGVTAGYGQTKEENIKDLQYANENVHLTYGMGFRIVINSNFIIAIDYGKAFEKQDGDKGIYIGLDYIF